MDRDKTAGAAEARMAAAQQRGLSSEAQPPGPTEMESAAPPKSTNTGSGPRSEARRAMIGGGADVADVTQLARDFT